MQKTQTESASVFLTSVALSTCMCFRICLGRHDERPPRRFSRPSAAVSNESTNAACSSRRLSVQLSHHAVIS